MGGHGGALSSTDEQQRDVVASSSHHLECQERRHSPSGRKARRASLRGRSGSRTQNRPTTFLVRHETEILHPTRSPSQGSPVEDSTYGVKSLDSSIGEEQEYDTVSSTADERSPKRKLSTSPILQHAQHLLSKTSNPPAEPSQPPSPHSFRSSPLLPLSRESSAGQLSASLTPFNIRSPYTRSDHDTSSTPRSASPRSFRSSDEDARFEHSSGSGEEGEDDAAAGASLFEEDMPLSIPQLVMPSMNFPRRRPFTERGSRVGKLRVGVAGAKGTASLLN